MESPVNKNQQDKLAIRLRATLQMHRSGVRMMFARLQRQYPNENSDQIRLRLNQWLQSPLTREQFLRRSA